jgi:cysteine synthase A
MLRLRAISGEVGGDIFAKLEFLSPSGSVKDRIAKYMIAEAERAGRLKHGSIILEATTGNTGIAFAMAAAVKGYRMVVVMPDGMSEERKQIIRAYGAELVFTPGGESDVDKCLVKVRELMAGDPHYWLAGQFENLDNVRAHEFSTAPEILQQTDGNLDAFVAGVGTGGTLTGVARVLKRHRKDIRIVAVEPVECAILSGGSWGRHRIEGIGDGFVPEILDRQLIDEVVAVPDAEAIRMARRLAREEGLFVGISSGANVHAAATIARKLGGGARIVTLLPDSGQRYLSTDLVKPDTA